jgi:hypothetical protein
MGWRVPTEDDIIATISVAELNAYKSSANWQEDPVDILCRRAAAMVRDALRSNGNVEMSPNEYEIPEGCISAAMDYVCYDVVKRNGGAATKERQAARQKAEEFFERIATGRLTPVGWNAPESEVTGGAGAAVVVASRHRITPKKVEGL